MHARTSAAGRGDDKQLRRQRRVFCDEADASAVWELPAEQLACRVGGAPQLQFAVCEPG